MMHGWFIQHLRWGPLYLILTIKPRYLWFLTWKLSFTHQHIFLHASTPPNLRITRSIILTQEKIDPQCRLQAQVLGRSRWFNIVSIQSLLVLLCYLSWIWKPHKPWFVLSICQLLCYSSDLYGMSITLLIQKGLSPATAESTDLNCQKGMRVFAFSFLRTKSMITCVWSDISIGN